MSDIPEKKKTSGAETAEETKSTYITDKTEISAKADKAAKEDDALEHFLSTSPEEEPAPKKASRINRSSVTLIVIVVLVTALLGVFFYLKNLPPVRTPSPIPDYVEPKVTETVDEKGERQVSVATDENGGIEQNGSGELISLVPADISELFVENTAGSFTVTASTPSGEATVYTLIGYETFDLQTGMADAVANDASSLSFSTIVAANAELNDYGLDHPRATVRVAYTDGTCAVIRVGGEAPAEAGVYITLGDSGDVFLVDHDAVDSFLYSALELISRTITDNAATADDAEFLSITVSGSRYPEPITLEPNRDEAINTAYIVTAPYTMFANAVESYDIAGSVRGLYAESVVCVNPSASQLSSYGLSKPYATVHAVYPDTTIDLSASSTAEDGTVYLYHPGKRVIYTIQIGAVSWARTGMDKLLSSVVLDINKKAVSSMTVTTGEKSYSIEVITNTQTVTNDSGDEEEVTTTEAFYDDKRIPADNFAVFFQNITGMKNLGAADLSPGEVIYELRVSYSTGRADDTITIYAPHGKICPIALNGTVIGTVSKSYANSLGEDILAIAAGKLPNSL